MGKMNQIKQENWRKRLHLFSNFNKGKLVTISLLDSDMSFEEVPLVNMVYESIKNNEEVVISLGINAIELNHIISTPMELWENFNELGVVTAMEIIDQHNNEYVLSLCG